MWTGAGVDFDLWAGKVFFKFNIKEGNDGFHKKVCMYAAGLVMTLDIGLTVYNHFAAAGAAAEVPPPVASNAGNHKGTKRQGQENVSAPIPQFQVSSARNPIVHWYEYYFCRGFQSAVGCSQRSMRATTNLDLDPKIAAQSRRSEPASDKIIRDTYSIDLLDRAGGNTQLR